MEKQCFSMLLLFMTCFVMYYIWYLHYEMKVSINIKDIKIQGRIISGSGFQILESYSTTLNSTTPNIHSKISENNRYGLTTPNEFPTKKLRILCWILTTPQNHKTKAQRVKETWGRRCDILLFMSSSVDNELPSVKLNLVMEDRTRLWQKSREAFKYVHKYYRKKADWFLKADDDTFVIVENLRTMLAQENSNDPVYFGYRMITSSPKTYVRQGFMSGGAGYVLSREALDRFVNIALNGKNKQSRRKCHYTKNMGNEDVEVGRCLESVNVRTGDTNDEFGKCLFHAEPPTHWLNSSSRRAIAKLGMPCCSNRTISFHHLSLDMMGAMEYLVYHIKPYGQISKLWVGPENRLKLLKKAGHKYEKLLSNRYSEDSKTTVLVTKNLTKTALLSSSVTNDTTH